MFFWDLEKRRLLRLVFRLQLTLMFQVKTTVSTKFINNKVNEEVIITNPKKKKKKKHEKSKVKRKEKGKPKIRPPYPITTTSLSFTKLKNTRTIFIE